MSLRREFLVDTGALARSLDALEFTLRAERVPEATVLDLRLVAEEVLTNVAKYGHDDTEAHLARIGLTLGPDEVTLEFRDDGRPFDPLQPPAEPPAPGGERSIGGLGLTLVRALVDDAAYARIGPENVLTVRKRLSGPDGRVP